MASWRQPDQEGLTPGWGNFAHESSVRQIAPGLMAKDGGLAPPQDSLYTASDLNSTSDGHTKTERGYNGGALATELDASEPAAAFRGGTRAPLYTKSRSSPFTRKGLFIAHRIVIFLIILAIVIPIAVIYSKRNQAAASDNSPAQSSSTPDGAQPTAAATSSSGAPAATIGAIQDSGIAAAAIGDPSIVFFQHTNGDIWQSSARGNSSSFKGKVLDGSNIREGTPIAAIQYTAASNNVTHIAYVGKDNVLRDSVQYNGTGDFEDGRLQGAQLQASSSPRVGLSLMSISTTNRAFATYPLDSVRLYYGGLEGQIHEAYISGGQSPACENASCIEIVNPVWNQGFTFPPGFNGDAGFHVTHPGNYSYLVCSTSNNTLGLWYMQNLPNDSGQWQAGSSSNSSQLGNNASVAVAGDAMVFYQDPNDEVKAIEFDPQTNLQNPWGNTFDVAKAASNTSLIGMVLNGASAVGVILQAANGAIAQYVRAGNGWTRYNVPVS